MTYLTINRRAALMGGALAVAAPAVLSSANPAAAAGASDLPMRAVQQFSLGDMRLTVIDDMMFTVPTAIFGANQPEGSVDTLFAKYGLP